MYLRPLSIGWKTQEKTYEGKSIWENLTLKMWTYQWRIYIHTYTSKSRIWSELYLIFCAINREYELCIKIREKIHPNKSRKRLNWVADLTPTTNTYCMVYISFYHLKTIWSTCKRTQIDKNSFKNINNWLNSLNIKFWYTTMLF